MNSASLQFVRCGLLGFALWLLASQDQARAETVYRNIGTRDGGIGLAADFAGRLSSGTVGDRLTLGGMARSLTQVTINLSTSAGPGGFEGNETADFGLFLYAVGNGLDGTPNTQDDTVGAQIGSTITIDNHPINPAGESLAFSLPGYLVPDSLIVAVGVTDVRNFDDYEGVSWDLVPSPLNPVGSSNPFFLYWNASAGTGLPLGQQGVNPIGARPDSNLSFEIVAIPEPGFGALSLSMSLAALAGWKIRHCTSALGAAAIAHCFRSAT